MDLQQLNHLDAEQKTRYMKLERLFGTEGWALVVEYLRTQADAARERELSAKSWEENRVWHGARLAFTLVAGHEELTEKEFSAIAAQNAEIEQIQNEVEYE